MKRISILSIHIICWTVLLFYFYGSYLLKKSVTFNDIAFGLSMGGCQVIEFYVCYLWVYPNFMKRGKIPQLIGGILVALFVFVSLRYLIEEVVYRHFFGFHNYDSSTTFRDYFMDNIYWGTSYIVIAGAAWGLVHTFRTEKKTYQLQAEARKAELAFLKSQINPHFLYNTLNYVYALAVPVSDQLAQAVLRLSDLMRYTLNESPDGKVSLARETEYLESYIGLFKMRFEPAFFVNFDQRGITDHRIASLLLIPFVENAFKHGVVSDPNHPVLISMKVEEEALEFSVQNQINNAHKDRSSGIGITNVQRRLDLIYPDRHELRMDNNGNTYRAVLNINLT